MDAVLDHRMGTGVWRWGGAILVATASWLLALAVVVGPDPARAAAPVCHVEIWPSDELNGGAGYGVRYFFDCNFEIRGYHVESSRVGMPRDDPTLPGQDYFYPANHDPSFRCETGYGGVTGGTPTKEFTCQDFKNHFPYYAGGYWNGTFGPPVCSDPPLRWSFDITGLNGEKQYGTFEIECGTEVGGERGNGDPTSQSGGDKAYLRMSAAEVRGYIPLMVKLETKRKPRRLRRICRRRSYHSFRCRLRFRIRKRGRRYRYRGTAVLYHADISATEYNWFYRFRGRRLNLGCARRRPGSRSCARKVRWKG